MNIREELFKMQDLKYREFHSRLMPTVNPEVIIGVRTPELRRFAAGISEAEEKTDFLRELPHQYYEENNLHAFLLERINDFDSVIVEIDRFLPFVDNWATCDMLMPRAFKKNKDRLLPKIYEWIKSDREYIVRFAVGMLMKLFLDEDFKCEYLELVSKIRSEKYYVNMMIAWYFATALAKQYNSAIIYLTDKRLPKWIHNKTVQKAVESKRISSEMKSYLNSLKV